MKKVLLIFACCFLFLCGCGKSELNINKVSKDLNTYTMELTYNSDHTLIGKQKLNYKNKTDTFLKKLCFHLYPKAFAEGAVNKPVSTVNINKAYPNGVDYGDVEILSANVNGETSEFTYSGTDNNILNVTLLQELEPLDSVQVEIEYKVYVPNINHRFGYGNNTVNMANFYPVVAVFENGEFVLDPYNSNGDPFYSDCSNYDVTLTVPNTYTVASTGVQEKVTDNGEQKTYNIKANCVRDFAFVMSEKFEVAEQSVDGVKVSYYYYDDENFEESLKAGVDAVKTFNKIFGKYPYSTLSVVKSNFVHGGMEYPNLIYISDEVEGSDYLNVIVHETAHQWWYGVVGSNAFRYGWLDEGLTEYSTVLFYEENPDYGVNTEELIKNTNNSYVTFVGLYNEVLGKIDTSMNRHLDEYDTEPEYVYMAYVKGLLLFDNLRDVVGKNKFEEAIQTYYKTYAFQNVTPEHLIGIFEKVCKTELKSYINSWVEGKVVIISMN